jgi:small subunit ribosomal protein S1
MSESFAELFEQSLVETKMRPGTIIKARVVDVTPERVIVSAGLKSEGVIDAAQFRNPKGELEVAIGDEVDVALDSVEDGFGETRLSREKAKRAKAWDELEKACEAGQTVTGVISDKVKGGFTVDITSIRAFLPGSLVDVRPVRDTSYLEGKPLEFKVVKVDRKRNNVVVSRRAVVESENSAEREALFESLKEGAIVKGLVKNLTDYGAFIDLGGIDGLLHITDMAWKRVKHPSEVVNIGDEITVKVLKFDRERTRVSLGLKQLGEDPWVDISRRYPEHTRLFGTVTNIADYGCFVEIEEGVEGLVHVSEMDWTNKNVHPSKVVHLGQEVEVMVLDIDEERRRISLGMKQCKSNPWEEFAATHNKNDRVSGVIKSITDFGIFIGLEGGIDGLVHLSDLSWDIPGEEAVRNFKKGDEIETVVLAVDAEREATINLGDGIEGVIRASEISRDQVDDARKVLKEGETIEAMIIGVDRKRRVINLSIKAKESEDEAAVLQEYSADSESGTTKLGDLLKEHLDTK